MKVFVAVRPTEPEPDDFCHAVDGELVYLPTDFCDRADCDCRRSVIGLASGLPTTTFMVADLPHVDRDLLLDAFTDALERHGVVCEHDGDCVADLVDEHLAIAADIPVGGICRAEHTTP